MRRTVGAEVTLVGLPPIVEFAREGRHYFAPVGFTPGKYNEESTVDPSFRTYLDWDHEANPYDGSDGSQYGKFGPGSEHREVTNHAFVSGNVVSLTNQVDVALYMAMITRDAGDPTWCGCGDL